MKFLLDAAIATRACAVVAEPDTRRSRCAKSECAKPTTVRLDLAENNGLVLLTKDEDFAMRTLQAQAGPVIVWLRVGNSSNRALRAWLEPRLPGIVQLVTQGSRLVCVGSIGTLITPAMNLNSGRTVTEDTEGNEATEGCMGYASSSASPAR